ncbi:class I SAM-dependent methyltransferase [Collimonas silvisoli]|uniref:class I SAM-dependent methyltransferase n=1 Tax=Collimonas silvisoli TaxID=2825884 RepID=UPI001B8AE941|nr:class I SAM-dependent methyltransferase [Collimonas silvisoli]
MNAQGLPEELQAPELEWSGERFIPGMPGVIVLEHLHRYAVAQNYAGGLCVLDIASGEGYGTSILAAVAHSAIGVDISPDAVKHAQLTYQAPNLEYRNGSCAAIPVESASIDLVVSFETIEHHDQHEAMMREIKRVLKPDGLLLISSPNKLEYSDVPGYDNPYHVKELYLDEFQQLLNQHFTHTALYGQRVLTASATVPMGSCDMAFKHFYDVRLPAAFDAQLHRPLYFLAFAGDVPLPDMGATLYEDFGTLDEPALQSSSFSAERTQSKLYMHHVGQTGYSEKDVLARPILLGGGKQNVKFTFQNRVAEIDHLRLDVTECPAVIRMESMRLLDAIGKTTWEWDGDTTIFRNMGEIQIHKLDDSSNEITLIATGGDPRFDFDLSPEVIQNIDVNWQLEIVLTPQKLSADEVNLDLSNQVGAGFLKITTLLNDKLSADEISLDLSNQVGTEFLKITTLLNEKTHLIEHKIDNELSYIHNDLMQEIKDLREKNTLLMQHLTEKEKILGIVKGHWSWRWVQKKIGL